MNRTELIEIVAKNTGHSKERVQTIIINTFEVIAEEMFKEPVSIINFGVFSSKEQKSRKVLVPGKGEVECADKLKGEFKMSRSFRNEHNKG